MASTSTQPSDFVEPSSSKHINCKYDVFLSFSGLDIRRNFLEYVYRALRQSGMFTFKDDDELGGGESITNELLKAIEQSSFSIVIISVNYGNSSWCLDELVHILQRKRTSSHVIYPVFYHVSPSDVRKREGEFGERFAKTAYQNARKADVWAETLREVADLKGWAYPDPQFANEATLIDNLVHNLFIKVIETYSILDEGLVGIKSRMTEVTELLDLGSREPRVVGLWGMGGIGKTTLAKVVYNFISWKFEGCSFIDNVTEVYNKSGVLALQNHLISDLLMKKDFNAQNISQGTGIIQKLVCRRKVLIVLDDVSEPEQLKDMIRELRWFSPGSRIIITTRNQHVLIGRGVQHTFKVEELNKHEAIELFKSKAFVENGETEEFIRLIDRAVQCATRVPLALEILGSSLVGGTVPVWESALDRLKESPGDKLQALLKISYDGLNWREKEILLDIACFFKGMDKDRVIKILDNCDFNPDIGFEVLVKKCLLTISVDNKLLMHDLVQKMGWSIVDEESRKDPGERSRLWRSNDVKDVLMDNTGTKKVEGIRFNIKKI